MSNPKAKPEQKNNALDISEVFEEERNMGMPEQGEGIGLAFSGGGIRSATFNLGVIQALAERRLLRKFDYLSTISGGGYIGSWLTLFIKRYGEGNVETAEEVLCEKSQENGKDKCPYKQEHKAIRFLRSYSNYLTPRMGLNRDALMAVATYMRNFLLNFFILICVVAGLLIAPRIAVQLAEKIILWPGFLDWYEWVLVLVLLSTTFTVILGLLHRPRESWEGSPIYTRWVWLICCVDLPVIIAGFLITCFYLHCNVQADEYRFTSVVFIYVMLWGLGVILALYRHTNKRSVLTKNIISFHKAKWIIAFVFFAVMAGMAGAAFMAGIKKAITLVDHPHQLFVALTLGPSAVIIAFTLMLTVHVGLMGRRFSEKHREVLSVYGGRLLAVAAIWAMIFTIALYGPALIKSTNDWILSMGGFAWFATTLFGVLFGKSEKTGTPESKRRNEALTKLAPAIFVVGLLVLLSQGVNWTLKFSQEQYPGKNTSTLAQDETTRNMASGICPRETPVSDTPVVTTDNIKAESWFSVFSSHAKNKYTEMRTWFEPAWMLIAILCGAFAAAFFISWRVNINLFSLHHFYRNRLTRCYLGATNGKRHPNPLTGFDPEDDVPLCELVGQRPMHIVGTAINLNNDKELAWQNRLAASFSFSPLHAGYAPASRYLRGGFRRVLEYGKDAKDEPMGLGTVVAISGAAASPNMGFHTSPTVAFLLTVFNVRLGHWCGDPVHYAAWRRRDPFFSLRYWLAELTGSEDTRLPFVSLSDGGHFENLGIYELVRRRCKLILASDAGADPEYVFGDLGEVMRKCYTDFGVKITFITDVDDIRPQAVAGVAEVEWVAKRHYAIAKIEYPGEEKTGTLIYWKSSLTAELPPDIFNYRRTHEDFPHQSTADQFFDESQFESYRHLGYQVAIRSLDKMAEEYEYPEALKG